VLLLLLLLLLFLLHVEISVALLLILKLYLLLEHVLVHHWIIEHAAVRLLYSGRYRIHVHACLLHHLLLEE